MVGLFRIGDRIFLTFKSSEAHEFWTNLKENVEFDLIEFRKSPVQRDEL